MRYKKPMRLCFVMFGAYPVFNRELGETFGGSEVELYNIAVYLAGLRNVKVDFIVGDYGQSDIEIRDNVRLIRVRYMKYDKYKSLRYKLLRYLYLFRVLLGQSSQIYVTKTASEVLGWLVMFQKFLKGKKVVFRLGSDKDAEPEFWRSSGRLYHLYKFGLKHCDKVYAQSRDQKRMLMENCGTDSSVLKNAFRLDGDVFRSDSAAIRPDSAESRPDTAVSSSESAVFRPDREAECSGKEFILWVSRCEPLKRVHLFVELARSLPQEKFVIIMPHAWKADELENKRIGHIITEVEKAAGEMKNLEYIEYVPFDLIQAYYDRAKLFVNTSEYEGFPNSFIQACIGRTGILSLRVNPDAFITEHSLGCCCQDSVARAIDFIKGMDAEKIGEMGRNAYEYVIRNHDVTAVGKIYMEDFAGLLG